MGFQSLGPTWYKERTSSSRLSSGLYSAPPFPNQCNNNKKKKKLEKKNLGLARSETLTTQKAEAGESQVQALVWTTDQVKD